MKRLHVEGIRLINDDGHEVMLNGLCFICRERDKGYLEPGLPDLLQTYAARGFNLIRLGIFWDGVEPEPGVYDEIYLDRIAEAIIVADQCGIYVFLDMHQDLFSAKFIDGAPAWATLDDDLPGPERQDIWYEAYLSSPAVIRSADQFWANAAASDGIGLLDHYEAMWTHLARRFSHYDNIIGFEPMNEPYMGSLAARAFGEALAAVQKLNPDFSMATAAQATPDERALMLGVLSEHLNRFDQDTLMPFYHRMLNAIRRAGDVPLVLGCNIYGTVVKTGIRPVTGPDGRSDPQQIYAPHGYDSVVDTDNYQAYNKDNVSQIFAMHRQTQLALGLPVIIGEWGNFPSGTFTEDLIIFMNDILERNLWHSTYHQYTAGMESDPNYNSLERGYPMRIAGRLLAYQYEPARKRLTARWQADPEGQTVLYHPDLTSIGPADIRLSGPADIRIEKQSGSGGILRVFSVRTGEITVVIEGQCLSE